MGLPDHVTTCLFDLDGVLTDTAAVHRAAWAATFDPVLEAHGQSAFTQDDYDEYVDGKPRLDGVRDFLRARGLDIPEGADGDPPEPEPAHVNPERKNRDVLARIQPDGVEVFPGPRRYVEAAVAAGLHRI